MDGFLDRLAAGPVLGDGGYLFELERRGHVKAGPYTPEVVLEAPGALEELHREFLRAGAEVLQALTFHGCQGGVDVDARIPGASVINREAVRIARKVAGREAFVAGSVTQTPAADAMSPREAQATWARQIEPQCEAGVDLFIGETFLRLDEALSALSVLKSTGLPVVMTMNAGLRGSADGFGLAECARRLVDAGADVVGVNCSWDPGVSLAIVSEMGSVAKCLACQPTAYTTRDTSTPFTAEDGFPLALEPLQLDRFEFAGFAMRARDQGVRFIGGCCGVAPYHVRAMAEALGRTVPASAKSPDVARRSLESVRARHESDMAPRPRR